MPVARRIQEETRLSGRCRQKPLNPAIQLLFLIVLIRRSSLRQLPNAGINSIMLISSSAVPGSTLLSSPVPKIPLKSLPPRNLKISVILCLLCSRLASKPWMKNVKVLIMTLTLPWLLFHLPMITVSVASVIPYFTRKAMPKGLKSPCRSSIANSSGPVAITSSTFLKSIIFVEHDTDVGRSVRQRRTHPRIRFGQNHCPAYRKPD